MFNRRRFLQSIAVAVATPTIACSCGPRNTLGTTLVRDPDKIIDLAQGFSYTVVSRRGQVMTDGLPVPGAHDGMAAFAGDDGRVILLRNHELTPHSKHAGPYADSCRQLPETVLSRFYDRGGDQSPGLGGVTTTVYNPATHETERQFLSLAGTDTNCAGGKTPWGSWLSCEESFAGPDSLLANLVTHHSHDQRHGYLFEVPVSATKLVDPVPLKDMGRFQHEAAAVHEPSGVVYLTEDQWHSLFYRFMPNVPGQLHKGGRLQALAIVGEAGKPTHNWDRKDVLLNQSLATRWIDLDNVDGNEDDLRLRGAALGAATFARGEGVTVASDRLAFTCTLGGPARLGQVFSYQPSPFEGTPEEHTSPGQLMLIAEADENSLFNNCDNLTMAPWGDLIVCEDTEDNTNHCALVGIRPNGSQYLVANNAYSKSELTGVCFSPDGETLFVNIQYPGTTVAITGPWPA